MDLTVDKRDRLVELLVSEYTIPEEFVDCVKVAVKQYATKNYSDETIEKMVKTPQSLSKGLALLRERDGKNDLSLFRGIVSEWLVCAEYNALKNKGSVVMTITNPDPSSKADLLHIINTGEGYKVVPGPDVKSGGSTYVFNQWKKIVNERYEIPMVDIDGVLTTEEGLKQLTQKQRKEFDDLCSQFPNKRPLDTVFDKSDINRVIADYLKYVEFDVLPSVESDLSIKDIDVSKIKDKLYSGEVVNSQSCDWKVFSSECKDILQHNSEMVTEIESSDVPTDQTQTKVSKTNVNDVTHESQKGRALQRVLDGIKIAGTFVKSKGSEAIKWMADNPEIVAAIGTVVVEGARYFSGRDETSSLEQEVDSPNDLYLNNDVDVNESADNYELEQSGSTNNYPEERKSPKPHPMRRKETGEVYAVRGGTPEEREELRREYGLD